MAKLKDVMGGRSPIIAPRELEGKRFYIMGARVGQNDFGDYIAFDIELLSEDGEGQRRTLFVGATAYRLRLVEELARLGDSIGPVTLYRDKEHHDMWVFADVD